MFYSVIYRCSRRIFSIEINFRDHAELSDEYINGYLEYEIEKFKADRGLTGKKHIIQKVEFSIDREDWFLVERNIK